MFGAQTRNKRRDMARATRSSTNLEKSEASATPRHSTKKRKRLSNADNGDHPSPKLPRTDAQAEPSVPSAADSHLDDSDATSILDILEAYLSLFTSTFRVYTHTFRSADSQGLLDRVFPLPPHAPIQGSFSLRVLLKHPSQHPLWVLRVTSNLSS